MITKSHSLPDFSSQCGVLKIKNQDFQKFKKWSPAIHHLKKKKQLQKLTASDSSPLDKGP